MELTPEDMGAYVDDRILQKQSEQRRFLYKDVETILDEGFLSHTCVYKDCTITFRSLLPNDLPLIIAKCTFTDDLDFMIWSLSHQTWIVNGFTIDPNDKDNIPWLLYHRLYSKMNRPTITKLYFTLVGLRLRCTRASRIVEGYVMEGYSRSRWLMSNKTLTNTNIDFTCKLWFAMNKYEDVRLEQITQWEHTRVICGSMSNTAYTEIGKLIDKMVDGNKTKVQETIEHTVNSIIYGESVVPKESLKVRVGDDVYELPIVKGAVTVDQMVEEMKQVLRGEQDFHDKMVEDYYERIRLSREKQHLERVAKIKEAQDKYKDSPFLDTNSDLVVLTPEELEKRTRDRKTTSTLSDSTSQYLYDKYVQPKIVAGVLGKTGPEQATADNNVNMRPQPTIPKTQGSLQDRIQNRTPTLK